MKKKITLFIDAFINFLLGVLLLLFNRKLASFLGIPVSDTNFYPNILGGVFIGITLALIMEALRKNDSSRIGLGLTGAICINLCGGSILILWLLFGNLGLRLQGYLLLWSLASVLLIISCLELIFSAGLPGRDT